MTDLELLSSTPPIINPALWEELAKHKYPMDDYRSFSVSWPNKPEEIKDQHGWQAFNGMTPN